MNRNVISCPFCSNRYSYQNFPNHRMVCFKTYYINRMNYLSRQLNNNLQQQEKNIQIKETPILKIDIETPKPIINKLKQVHFTEQPFQKKYEEKPQFKQENIVEKIIVKKNNVSTKPKEHQEHKKPIQEIIIEKKKDEKKNQIQVINSVKSNSIKIDPNSNYIFYKDQTYEDFLKNKRVIIVGPANSVLKNTRDFIESFDVIIRLNKSLPISEKLIPNIGVRTDILYNNLNLNDDPGRNRIPNNLLEKYGVKYVSCPYPPIHPFLPDIIYFLNQNKKRISFHHIPTGFYRKIEANLQTRPNTGLCAILDILRYPIKELYITGITFFTDGYYNQYKNIKNFSNFYNQMNSGLHQQSPQREILRNMFLMDTRIKVDNNLSSILLHRFDSFQKDLKRIFLEQSTNLLYNNLLGQNTNIFTNKENYFQIIQNYNTSYISNHPRIYVDPVNLNDLTHNDILVLTNFNNWNNNVISKVRAILMLVSPSQFWIDSLNQEILSKIFIINSLHFKKYSTLVNKVDFKKDLSFIMFLIHLVSINGCKIECSFFSTLHFSNNLNQNRKEILFLRYLEKKGLLFKFNGN